VSQAAFRIFHALAQAQMLRVSCLAALVVVALNDHVLKEMPAVPRAFANKASDFGGLYFFPFLCYDIMTVLMASASPFCKRPRLFLCVLVATGLVFLGAKIPGWSHFIVVEVARVVSPFPVFAVADLTDTVARVVLPLAWWVFAPSMEVTRVVSPFRVLRIGLRRNSRTLCGACSCGVWPGKRARLPGIPGEQRAPRDESSKDPS
jgi:hypothetical protein